MTRLPVEPVLPSIIDALASHTGAVLQAPPGAGKTTLVPPALLSAPWLRGQLIVMLEPRRVAARAAASRTAELLGESVGGLIGYRTRGDSRVSARTRIEIVTEGVLTRRLQRDPTLDGVGLVIFDEFHERHLQSDVGLALALRTQRLVRDDLRLLIMSATLDGASVSRYLGDAPIVTSEGRAYDVETRYLQPRGGSGLAAILTPTIHSALSRDSGDLLVFLPGAGEIARAAASLSGELSSDVVVTPLHGSLDATSQDRAIRPDPQGRRKIVLATSIAETSLTIDGVRVVIDTGFSRVPRFDPATGMTRLETVRVSKASADQRRGRAGRTAPGVCYRLWFEHDSHQLLDRSPPEILHADLTPLALDLAAAGVADPADLAWLDEPPPASFAHARELLGELDAIDERGAITPHGKAMAEIPVHPRLAHMLLGSRDDGRTRLACEVAALLEERDIAVARPEPLDVDIALRVEAVRGGRSLVDVDARAVQRVRAQADRLARHLRAGPPSPDDTAFIGSLVALAYPDRVAQRRAGPAPRYVMRNGRGAELTGGQTLANSPHLVIAQLDDRRPESRVFLAAALSLSEIRERFADQIETERVVELDEDSGSVVARRRDRLGAIVLRESSAEAEPEDVRRALLDAVRRRGIARLGWSDAATRFRDRLRFVAAHDPTWPDVSDVRLHERLDEWLGPALAGARRLRHVERLDLGEALAGLLDWRQRRALDDLAPTHIVVPSGSRIPIDYTDATAPALAVRLQEVFGLEESPRVLGGRVPLTMHLLSPAHRPVQVTRDLAGFWRTSYFDVRKDLRGRYPKHEWPEDPLSAQPTNRAKRRPRK
ncbi:MAG TPA: ATP-dependent helicase HrpB [Gemmatimonadaceae bacterium]|nr:ATP-dependent helicase HrpB [Gemmatimonadaceae bacterium]